jgi:hypothetical protein
MGCRTPCYGLYAPKPAEVEFSDVCFCLVEGFQKRFKVGMPLKIYRELIGLCFSDGS